MTCGSMVARYRNWGLFCVGRGVHPRAGGLPQVVGAVGQALADEVADLVPAAVEAPLGRDVAVRGEQRRSGSRPSSSARRRRGRPRDSRASWAVALWMVGIDAGQDRRVRGQRPGAGHLRPGEAGGVARRRRRSWASRRASWGCTPAPCRRAGCRPSRRRCGRSCFSGSGAGGVAPATIRRGARPRPSRPPRPTRSMRTAWPASAPRSQAASVKRRRPPALEQRAGGGAVAGDPHRHRAAGRGGAVGQRQLGAARGPARKKDSRPGPGRAKRPPARGRPRRLLRGSQRPDRSGGAAPRWLARAQHQPRHGRGAAPAAAHGSRRPEGQADPVVAGLQQRPPGALTGTSAQVVGDLHRAGRLLVHEQRQPLLGRQRPQGQGAATRSAGRPAPGRRRRASMGRNNTADRPDTSAAARPSSFRPRNQEVFQPPSTNLRKLSPPASMTRLSPGTPGRAPGWPRRSNAVRCPASDHGAAAPACRRHGAAGLGPLRRPSEQAAEPGPHTWRAGRRTVDRMSGRGGASAARAGRYRASSATSRATHRCRRPFTFSAGWAMIMA